MDRREEGRATRLWIGFALALGALVIALCALALVSTWPRGGTTLLPASAGGALPPAPVGVHDAAHASRRDEPVLLRPDPSGRVPAWARPGFAPVALTRLSAASGSRRRHCA